MKRFLLLCALCFGATSCNFNMYRKYSEEIYLLNLKVYADEGFFITPASSINEVYDPISEIEYRVIPRFKDGKQYYPTADEALSKLVEQAKAMGANAILNLSHVISKYESNDIVREIIVSGTAVNIVDRQPAQPVSAVE